MAKQTFTTGQVLTAAQMTSLQQTAMGGGSTTAKTTSYVLVAADAGTTVAMNAAGSTTITVNTSLFSEGDTVTIQNRGAGVCTVTAGTATVTTSGSLVLAQYQGGVLYFNSASSATFYQFATPASGDIEGVTAGTGISGGGTSGTVTITNSMATAIDAKGDLIVGTGADTFSKLSVGTNGHTLVADSAEATGLKWAAPAGGGKVLQMVTATNNTSKGIFNSTYTDTNLTASITPTLVTSTILVLITTTIECNPGGDRVSMGAGARIVRGATTIYTNDKILDQTQTGNQQIFAGGMSIVYLDSPATTSSTTYKLQGNAIGTNPETYFNRSGPSTITLLEMGA